jgi:homoserine dehydrogenase
MPATLPIKITLYGYGNVGRPLVEMIKSNPNINLVRIKTKTDDKILEDTESNIIIEAINNVNEAKDILKQSMLNNKDVITCNKELIYLYRKELFEIANQTKKTIYLNSIIAGATDEEFKEALTNKNFEEYIYLNPFDFRGADGEKTAQFIYEDIKRYISVNYGIL